MPRMKKLTIELPRKMAAPVSGLLLGLDAGAVSEEQIEDGEPLIHAYFKEKTDIEGIITAVKEFSCLLYTSPSPRDRTRSRMPSSA